MCYKTSLSLAFGACGSDKLRLLRKVPKSVSCAPFSTYIQYATVAIVHKLKGYILLQIRIKGATRDAQSDIPSWPAHVQYMCAGGLLPEFSVPSCTPGSEGGIPNDQILSGSNHLLTRPLVEGLLLVR